MNLIFRNAFLIIQNSTNGADIDMPVLNEFNKKPNQKGRFSHV